MEKVLATYCPKDCTITINNHKIVGMDESFIEVVEDGFLLRLLATSDSLDLVNEAAVSGRPVAVEVIVALEKDGVRIEDYDIEGAFYVEKVGYKLSTSFPVVTYRFTN